ncbi:MAG: hypothetical protein FJY74_09420 [Candidatus Eisenbacteria bacterium]|nr:hypothetical protein [Candidatus Eisenbacteria bacterium]
MNACIRPGHLPHVVLAALLAAAVIAPAAASGDALELLTAEAGPVPTEAGRDVPSTVWFQGFLADSSTGDPINATYTVVARIYSLASGGSLLWGPETHSNTSIVEGWFNTELGKTVSPLPSFATPPYYLELVVNGDAEPPLEARERAVRAARIRDGGRRRGLDDRGR